MDCSKKSASAVGDLPEGPLMDILSRVPAKSVCRFKCVSKAWLDLITDPHHRKKLPQAMQGLFCETSNLSKESSDLLYSFSFIDLAARSVPLDIDPSFSFLTEQPGIRFVHFADSCNGLVLFEHFEGLQQNYARLGYIVCNPTTKEWKSVPACGSPTTLTYPYLSFHPAVSSHFNLVQFQVEDGVQFQVEDSEKILSVHAYSSETGAWSENQIDEQGEEGQLEGWRRFNFLIGYPQPCPFINGFLHLIVLDKDQTKIVVLDVQGKARRTIPAPCVPYCFLGPCYFGESQGQLHYMTQELLNPPESVTLETLNAEQKYRLSIWVLQDYDAQEWVLKGTVNTDEVFGENSDSRGREFEVVALHQHRNVVFFAPRFRDKLEAYDMDHEELSTIATFDDPECLVGTARYIPYF